MASAPCDFSASISFVRIPPSHTSRASSEKYSGLETAATGTLAAGADYTHYLFADRIYPTPQAHRKFGDYAYQKIRSRW